jgi:lantibiotic biosynthesis protein
MREKKETVVQDTVPLYRPADFYMLRAPILPATIFSHVTAMEAPALHVDQESSDERLERSVAHSQHLLQTLASQPGVEQALTIASFSLMEGLARIHGGEHSSRSTRAFSRLLRYLVRMSTRPTPFGLFAGIAVGTFAEETTTSLVFPTLGQMRTRPDMSWLLSIVQRIEQTPEVLTHMRVRWNQMASIVGGRVLLPNADAYGQNDARFISLRATPVVQAVLEDTAQPIHYADLQSRILARFPQATMPLVERLLQQLWDHHFLLSTLHPPLTIASPGSYVLEQLSQVPGTEAVCADLQTILDDAATLDRRGADAPLSLIQNLAQKQEHLVPNEKEQRLQLQIDCALNVQSSLLTKQIGEAAAQAAETLLRLTPLPHGYAHLREYRMAFLERYGENAEVPLLDLLSAEAGLDAPTGYLHPPRTFPLSIHSEAAETKKRDRILSALVVGAVNERSMEVELTDQLLQTLQQWSPKEKNAPLSLEIYLQIHASSRAALDVGQWSAIVSPNCGSPAAGRSFGRFFDLLSAEDHARLQQLIDREEALSPDVVFAELSYFPRDARAANVSTRPALRRYEILVGTTPTVPAEQVIALRDLVVGVRNARFYVRSLRLGKEVIVCQSHMLNSMMGPNICRFLVELGQDARPCLSPFDWGSSAAFPFLPRLRQGKVILSPAQWNLTPASIVPMGKGNENTRWVTGFEHWRRQWRVPRYVYMTEFDNRLLLDLEHPLMVAELQMELAKVGEHGQVALQELLPDLEHLWLQDSNGAGYFSEIVVPLLRATKEPERVPADGNRVQSGRVILHRERSSFPGDDWVYFKLYAASKQHDELIAGPFQELVRELSGQEWVDRGFYIRYADPDPHLRLRFRASESAHVQPVLTTLLQWSRQLVERELVSRFSIDTYEREVERYGGPEAIDLLEQVFTFDSFIVAEIVAAHFTKKLTIDPLGIAVLSLDTLFACWGLDVEGRLAWLRKHIDLNEAKKEFGERRQFFCDLLAPWQHTRDEELMQQRKQVLQVFSLQEEYLRHLAAQVRALGADGVLWTPEEQILGSLAHMHLNRLLGIDRQRENKIYAFWRLALESVQLRPKSVQHEEVKQ